MSSGAGDGFEYKLFTDTVVVLIVSCGTSTSIDLCVVDGVEWADGTSSLELELTCSTGEDTDSAGILGVS